MAKTNVFKKVPASFLSSIATDNNRTPTLYHSSSWLLKEFFWLRLRLIHRLLKSYAQAADECLDFGGGNGVFLPTLSEFSNHVTLVDLETREAEQLIRHCGLSNVRVVQGDISSPGLITERFKVIIAADVLEHFKDVGVALTALKRWLAPEGILITSLPTENWVYTFLRKVFGIEKPFDHYHTGYEVEEKLRAAGFLPLRRTYSPLLIPVAPLYLITVWRRSS